MPLPRTGDAWIGRRGGDAPGDARPTPTATACPISPTLTCPCGRRTATSASTWRRSRPASGRRRSATHFSSTSTAAVGRRRACRDRAGAAALIAASGASSCRRWRRARRARRRGLSGPIRGRRRAARRAGRETDQPADFGAIPEACPGVDLLLRLRGELVRRQRRARFLRPHHRHRHRAAGGGGSTRGAGSRWPSISVTYRYVNDAGLASNTFSFGPATIGYHLVLATTARAAVAAYARALMPIDTARQVGSLETGGRAGRGGAHPARPALGGRRRHLAAGPAPT